jgi:hypothetical protein
VSYGSLGISDYYNDEWLSARLPLVSVSASYHVTPKLSLTADFTFGKGSEVDTESSSFVVGSCSHSELNVTGSVALSDYIRVLAGWTRFASGYTGHLASWYDEEVTNVADGFKLGAAVSVPLVNRLFLDATYAFVRFLRTQTLVDGDENEAYDGYGHQIEAGLKYNAGRGLMVTAGFSSHIYQGFSHYAVYETYNLSRLDSGFLRMSYSF